MNIAVISLVLNVVALAGLGYLMYTINKDKKEEQQKVDDIVDKGTEHVLAAHEKLLKKIEVDTQEFYKILDKQGKQIEQSLTRCGVVRFNPFRGEGGNQSFSVALLDDSNNGVLISALYSRNTGTRIYAKEINNGESEIPLTNEEKTAIEQAR